MQDMHITPGDIMLALTAAAIIFSIAQGLVKGGMSYLSLKFGKNTPEQNIEAHTRAMAEQSQQCRFDHSSIGVQIQTTNNNIAQMLEQNGQQLKEIASMRAMSELHHERTMNHLKRIEERLGQP